MKLVQFMVALILLASVVTIGNAQISQNNPYRSFNISGVNYGSMEWEKKYGKQSGQNRTVRPRLYFRVR